MGWLSHMTHTPNQRLDQNEFMSSHPSGSAQEVALRRFHALNDTERQYRLSRGLEMLWDDAVELDDGGGAAHGIDHSTHPDWWWTETQIGRRAIEALYRLGAKFDQQRSEQRWADAWDTLELIMEPLCATVWLRFQPPLRTVAPASETEADDLDRQWIRELLRRNDHDPVKLVPNYLHNLDAHDLARCYQEVRATADALPLAEEQRDALRRFLKYEMTDTSLVIDAVMRLGEHSWNEVESAVSDGDDLRLAAAVRCGAATLDIFLTLIDDGHITVDLAGGAG